MTRLFPELFELLRTRMGEIRNEFEACSNAIECSELIGRMEEICVVLHWLRSHVVNKFNARMAKARARVQVLLH